MKPRLSIRKQRGAVAVEFSLALLIFITFLLAITDVSRMLFTWNAATEATREGARYAAVCDDGGNQDRVLARMQALLPQIAEVEVGWVPAGCGPASCEGVSVRIVNLDYQWISPIAGLNALAPIRMPGFSTFLPREMMGQDPHSAEICE